MASGDDIMNQMAKDQEVLRGEALSMQLKMARAKRRAKERLPGRNKEQTKARREHGIFAAAYGDAIKQKHQDRVTTATKMAMDLLDLPFSDKAIQIIRGTKDWVETLRNELRMKRHTLNLLAQKQLRGEKSRRAGYKQYIFEHGIKGVRRVMRKHGTVSTLQQVEWECPMGIKWSWAEPNCPHPADREESVRRWVHEAQKVVNENLQISIGEEGVEVTVTTLTDMPDLVEWALSMDDGALSLPLSIVVSKGPWKGDNMVTAAESFFQTNAYHPFAVCSKGHTNPMPMTKETRAEPTAKGGPTMQRELHHFCHHKECMCMDAEHFRSNRQEVKDTAFLVDKGIFSFRTIPQYESIKGPVNTFREFSRYVAKMSDRKAAGKDMLPADLFKRAPEAFRRNAWSLINKILTDEYICAPDVLEAKVILLCKDVSSPDLLGNYRPIALCNAFYQLLNSIITSRLRHLTEKHAVLEAT